ncbi:MAG: CotH kinase family protein [Bacteroidota bacterium]
MIISQQTGRKRQAKLEQWLIGGLLLLLGVALLLIFAGMPNTNQALQSTNTILCDAEQVEGDQFVHNGLSFGDSELQSAARARSGTYACELPADGQMHYGFTFDFTDPVPGKVYKASVWRFQQNGSVGRLAVQGFGEASFYEQQELPSLIEDGWDLLEIRFSIPFGTSYDRINVHVYGGGTSPLYFDDFQLEEIDQWANESFQPAILDLQLSDQAYSKLKRKREKALVKGILETNNKDWVEAMLSSDDAEPIPIKIRLKGDWLDHLEGEKWSFRVKVKSPYAWKRMRTFSLHTPEARYFLHEWLLHQFWEKEDVLTTRYDFVELRLNGKSLGIYAYEEHFDKQLVEYRQRREGPIVKLGEEGFWAGMKGQLQHHGFFRAETEHTSMLWENAPIESFHESAYQSDSLSTGHLAQAQNLLYQFKYGLKPASEIFEVERLAKYYAISDLLNAYHGIVWHNQRFYYNPILNKLEPIGFDGFGDKPIEQYTILGTGALDPQKLFDQTVFSHLFMDATFVEKYIGYLYQFSDYHYFDPLLDSLSNSIGPRAAFLKQEFPEYQLDLAELATQFNFVRSLLLPPEAHAVAASYLTTKQELLLRNRHNLPIQLVGFGNNRLLPTTQLDSTVIIPAQIPRKFWLRVQKLGQIWDYNAARFLQQQALAEQGLPKMDTLPLARAAKYLFYQVVGIDSLLSAPISTFSMPANQVAHQSLGLDRLQLPDSLVRIDGQHIQFLPGKKTIKQPIIIPKNYQVSFVAGTQLDFVQGAFFFCKSPITAIGTGEQPIRFTSSDKSARGFTVFETHEKSHLQYVLFDQWNTLNYDQWVLTGGVTFYEADALLYQCRILNSQSEDAINFIRSEFELQACAIRNSAFDGLDSDFCKGRIEDCSFVEIGNDAVDFSGSIVNIKNASIQNCGDKGISVGEESDVHVLDSRIDGAELGVASKDLSLLFLRNIDLKNCEQGFTAFQKKPEFGGGKIIVESYTIDRVKRLHNIAPGSSLQLGLQLIQ